ncbi:radical SAM protein [Candidatus Gracilibacteria bacterium]|nr:radical SAM protein [Candidatus Gracilibacteria bacterium]
MYYRIKENIIRRNEKNSFMLLHPVSNKFITYGKTISDYISKNGIIDSSNLSLINYLQGQGLIEGVDNNEKFSNEEFGSDDFISAPLNVTIQITNKCNLRCKHCHRVDKGSLDIDFKKIKKLIDELSDMKIFNINISGGEPLLYKGLFDVIEYISSKGIKVTMSTNLILRNDKIAKKMYEFGVRQLHISLDSADAKYHDYIRGSKNSYSIMIKNLEIIKKVGIEFTIVTTLINQTIEDYSNIIDFSFRLGASGHKTNTLVPQGQGKTLDVEYYNNKDLLKSYIEIFSRKKEEYSGKMSIIGETMFLINMGDGQEGKPDVFKIFCPAGVLTCAITEKGDVLPCPFFSEVNIGNIYKDSFKSLRKNNKLLNDIRINKSNENSGCQARAYGISNSIKSEDPYTYKNIYNIDDHKFYNDSAIFRDKFISKIGHGIVIKGEKGNKDFYGLIHNYLLNSDLTLEIGTGTGIVPKTLGKLGKNIISVDFSKNMLKVAKKNCEIYNNIVFKKEDINKLSFKDQTFNLIIKRLAPDNLNQIFRVLKDSGNFINFTNGENDGKELKEMFGFPYHESVSSYRDKLIKQGFNILYEKEFQFEEIYESFDVLANMLNIAPIIPDFLDKKEYYLDKIKKYFNKHKSFILTRHKYLTNAKK